MDISNYLNQTAYPVIAQRARQLVAHPNIFSASKIQRVAQVAIISVTALLILRQVSLYLVGRLLIYGCQNQDARIVHLFSRFVSDRMAREIAIEFIQSGNSSALEFFLKNGHLSAVHPDNFESMMQLISSPFLKAIISTRNHSLILKTMEALLQGNNLLLVEEALKEVASAHQRSKFPDEQLKEIIPVYFKLLRKCQYYTQEKARNQQDGVIQKFLKGLSLKERIDCFEKLFKADAISLSLIPSISPLFLKEMIARKNYPLILKTMEALLQGDNLLLVEEALKEVTFADQRSKFPNEQLKEIIPIYFKLLQKCQYYTQEKARNQQDEIIQMFLTGLELKVIDINTPLDSENNRYLHLNINNNSITRMSLEKGADPNLTGSGKATAFHLAVERSNLLVIKCFLELGANIEVLDDQGFTPLRRSLEKGRVDVALILLRAKAQRQETFPYCSDEEFKKFILLLLKYLSETFMVNIEDKKFIMPFLQRAIELKIMDINTPLDPDQNRFLYWVIEDEKMVGFLLNNGANPNLINKNGLAPLHLAMERGHTQVLQLLLQKKANIEMKDKNGITPLVRSIQQSRTLATLLLCQQGASIPEDPVLALQAIKLLYQVEDGDEKRLLKCMLAFWRQINWLDLSIQDQRFHLEKFHDQIFSRAGIELIQDTGIINNPLTRDGLTLIHLAVLGGNVKTIRYIVSQGGDVTVRLGPKKLTVLHLAVEYCIKSCLPYFLSQFPALLNIRAGANELTAFEFILACPDIVHYTLIPIFINECKPVDLLPSLEQEMEKAAEPPRVSVPIEVVDYYGHVHRYPFVIPNDFVEEARRKQKYTYFRANFIQLLKKDQAFQLNFNQICHELNHFKTAQEISKGLIYELSKHQPYTRYLKRVSYTDLFEDQAQELLTALKDEAFQACFFDLGQDCLHKLNTHAQVQREEASQLKEALLALDAMYKILQIPPTILTQDNQPSQLHQMSLQIAAGLEKLTSKKSPQKKSFIEDFDEKDGSILVGNILAGSKERAEETKYCKNAYEMGLTEGRDFRAIGIDDNIASLCSLIDPLNNNNKEEQQNLIQQFTNEIKKKKKNVQEWKDAGYFTTVSSPDQLEPYSEWSKWERLFNQAFFLFLLSKEDKFKELLKTQKNVTALSELKEIDLPKYLQDLFKIRKA